MFSAIVFRTADSGPNSERAHAEYLPDGAPSGFVEFATYHKPSQCHVVAFIGSEEFARDTTCHYGARPRVYDGAI